MAMESRRGRRPRGRLQPTEILGFVLFWVEDQTVAFDAVAFYALEDDLDLPLIIAVPPAAVVHQKVSSFLRLDSGLGLFADRCRSVTLLHD